MSRRRSTVRQYSAEDQALTDISKEAENRLAAKRAARVEAREIRMKEIERQQKEAEEKERLGSDYGTSRSRQPSSTASGSRRGSIDSSEGTNDSMSSKDRDLKKEMRILEEKYKGAMMTSAQLDNERQSLVYQVELFKDQIEELTEAHTELQREYKDKNRNLEMTKRELQASQLEVKSLQEQNDCKDRLITESGFVIVAAENGELALERSNEPPSANGPVGTGGLLLSSESLVLLNKGREGSLGMHSLASSQSATHTPQSASDTDLSQPPSHTRAEEPQLQSPIHNESTESVTTCQGSEGSSVDGPTFQKVPEGTEKCADSSPQVADKAETGICVEAVSALSDQPVVAVSHSPDDNEFKTTAHSSSDNTMKMTCLSADEVTSQKSMGSESAEDNTPDGMLTQSHDKTSDPCKDNGQKESDEAGGVEQNLFSSGKDQTDSSCHVLPSPTGTKSNSEGSQSDLPSVVITECSRSQQLKSQDSEDEDDIEFFDAVSTPLPSPMDTKFSEFVEIEAGTKGNMATLACESSKNDREASEEDIKEDTGESGRETVGKEDKESAEDNEKESSGKDDKDTAGENDKEIAEVHDKERTREDGKEMSEEVSEGFAEENIREVIEEDHKDISGKDGKNTAREDDKEGADVKKVDGNDGSVAVGDAKDDQEDDKEKIKEDSGELSDDKLLETGAEGMGRDLEETGGKSDSQEVEYKDTKSDSEIQDIKDDQVENDHMTEMTAEEDNQVPPGLPGSDVVDKNKYETNDGDIPLLRKSTAVDEGMSASTKNGAEECGEKLEKGIDDYGAGEEGKTEQVPVRKDSGVNVDVYESGETGTGSEENMLQQSPMPEETSGMQGVQGTLESLNNEIKEEEMVLPLPDSQERQKLSASSDDDQCASPSPDSNSKDVQQKSSQGENELGDNHEQPGSVTELDEIHTTSSYEVETVPVAIDSQDGKQNIEDGEDSDMKSKDTGSNQSQTEPAPGEDNNATDTADSKKEDSGLESKECPVDKTSEEVEEVPDSLSPMLGSRKQVNRRFSEGGTSEDSEAQLNDDEYDFDDIGAVLDEGSPVTHKGKDTEPNANGDSDDKVSFGSKDSGLQESFANKDNETNKEDAVSFGSRDSGLQESASIKERETGCGDTVSMQSRDSGAGIDDISSVQSQDGSGGGAAIEPEKGAAGGSSEADHVVTGSRESLDLEARLDKMASASKNIPSKEKHEHKKSKKFKMFKKIFHK